MWLYAGMSQAGGQGGRTPPRILAPSLLHPPRFLAPPLTTRPPRFSDLGTCLLWIHLFNIQFEESWLLQIPIHLIPNRTKLQIAIYFSIIVIKGNKVAWCLENQKLLFAYSDFLDNTDPSVCNVTSYYSRNFSGSDPFLMKSTYQGSCVLIHGVRTPTLLMFIGTKL